MLADQLVSENPFFSRIWHESLRPAKSKLLSSLAAIYRDRNRSEFERTAATNFLADYAADQPELLANLLMDGDEKQFAVMFPIFKKQSRRNAVSGTRSRTLAAGNRRRPKGIRGKTAGERGGGAVEDQPCRQDLADPQTFD